MIPGHVTTARALVGTRWGHRGRGPYRLDCAGVVVVSLEANGYDIEDQDDYGREPAPASDSRLRGALADHFGPPVAVGRAGLPRLRAGDIPLFRGRSGSEPMHVGILGDYPLGGLSLIHASNDTGLNRVVEHRFAAEWTQRFVEAYRPGVR